MCTAVCPHFIFSVKWNLIATMIPCEPWNINLFKKSWVLCFNSKPSTQRSTFIMRLISVQAWPEELIRFQSILSKRIFCQFKISKMCCIDNLSHFQTTLYTKFQIIQHSLKKEFLELSVLCWNDQKIITVYSKQPGSWTVSVFTYTPHSCMIENPGKLKTFRIIRAMCKSRLKSRSDWKILNKTPGICLF